MFGSIRIERFLFFVCSFLQLHCIFYSCPNPNITITFKYFFMSLENWHNYGLLLNWMGGCGYRNKIKVWQRIFGKYFVKNYRNLFVYCLYMLANIIRFFIYCCALIFCLPLFRISEKKITNYVHRLISCFGFFIIDFYILKIIGTNFKVCFYLKKT